MAKNKSSTPSTKASKPYCVPKKSVIAFSGLLVGSLALGLGMQVAFSGQVAPGTFALNSNISFEDADKVQEELSLALEGFEKKSIEIIFKGSIYEYSLEELGIKLDKTETIESIPIISPASVSMFGAKEVKALYSLDEGVLKDGLSDKIIDLNKAVTEPQINWNYEIQDFEITTESAGWSVDLGDLKNKLDTKISSLNDSVIEIATIEIFPTFTKAVLEAEKDDLIATINSPTEIFTDNANWKINWRENLHLLDFKLGLTPGEPPVSLTLKKDLTTEHLNKYIAPEVEVAAGNVTILQAENGTISFEGTATDGLSIDMDTMLYMLDYALNKGLNRVEIPLKITQGLVDAPKTLREIGINELVATGFSSFSGSPYNRMHNINVAIKRFDGVLVAPGEIFSFGNQLGVVDGSTGYAQELVIKEGETIPEYGGGICQVSSTLFRAILFGGFPVNERKAHSYAVAYYAYPLGWGLDATVYPPAVDLKFTNDGDTYLLMQAYTDGYFAYFKFYGTKDGRAAEMDGPYISNRAGAPPDEYLVTPDLSPGEIKKVDSAHNGFTASWNRTVTYPVGHPLYPDGHAQTETFVSPYTPWSAKYMVGEGTPGYEAKETIDTQG